MIIINRMIGLCLVAGFLLAGAALAAKTNYVSRAGTQTVSPYTSWALATTNIQDAINDTVAGDTVLVSNGTYSINDQISITTAITVRSLWGASSTIVVRAASGTAAPQHRIFSNSAAATLDGFTVQNGYLPAVADPARSLGGGIYMSAGTVQNCVIYSNALGSAWTSAGGGVYISGGTLQFSTIISNQVDGVCGVSSALLISNTISYNSGNGANLANQPTAKYCVFENNAGSGASIYGVTLNNCIMRFNTAASGGGLYCVNGNTILDCTIVSNTATTAGGGVYTGGAYSPLLFRRCVISANTNANYPGIYFVAGGDVTGDGTRTFELCRVTDNRGRSSVYHAGAPQPVRFRNCTIAADQSYGFVIDSLSTNTSSGGQLVYPLIQNTIIYNHATNIFSTNAAVLTAILANSFTNSCAPQLTAPGFNNVTGDPLFLAPAAWDYHFKSVSPCAYTGTTNVFSIYTNDIENVPYSGNRINMGCYETMQMIWNGTVFRIK